MVFSLMNHNQTFITRFLCFHKSTREIKITEPPAIYRNNHDTNVINSIKMISNSKHRADKEHTKHRKTTHSFSERMGIKWRFM